jgi:hypothetical protein
VLILKGPVNSGFWRAAVCPLFLVGSRHFPSACWHVVVEGGTDGAFLVSEMRLCDRGEAIEFTP